MLGHQLVIDHLILFTEVIYTNFACMFILVNLKPIKKTKKANTIYSSGIFDNFINLHYRLIFHPFS